MKIDTKDLVGKSERFALDVAQQISQITLEPFLETSFHCSEFRNSKVLGKHLHRIAKSDYPLIYVFEIKSASKVKAMLKAFEAYHALNLLKTKNRDRVNLSKYNKKTSTILYVGSSTTDFRKRVKDHLGTQSSRTYAMHLCRWDGDADYEVSISAYQVISQSNQAIGRFIVEILEQQLWDALQPVFGKRSGL
ncbi:MULTISPECIES: hypothetical protein [Flavobacterium]|uniref:GIY-YIG domain-containing protein n=1 Tax=Flavobacterium johnsoniae (strain ATCC 17061 / DSM 2064 / JCM 8514 / BCRC 14874 / CCUG 350202 / NBRC 14942 / NCIMB 11054 / UW101) TaxID=376686 RepID=A5FFK7_FLAJ1|nr:MULTISPECIES: hypothetical protein [Flavobacterium]ABQ06019.1 hypothetical protein Fjoh_2998 [Flavobacterium johnsoniae UW101]EJG02231.1 hypothetical protein FF52_06110 [Flavobacterium sp. F52]OXG00614.1 hypothetical protein B0A63_08860 [Flavobacterium johnsoniae UW101]WQG81755.1 hypothetical protein SR927_01370 [Flavobacterium johnsoniae UW101]SHK63331.1 hypothetical protein SAMN05444146_1725 [Flavobacterium johnsoniae]